MTGVGLVPRVAWYNGWYKRLQAALLAIGSARYNRAVAPYKRELLGALAGRVVEIGPGAGANLPFFPAGISWIGVEPNPYAHPYLKRMAARHGLAASIELGNAQALPFADASVDAVVSTLVLCTVPDVPAALREIRRVLRPGGRFVFIEHVAAPAGTHSRRVQHFVRPVWQMLADGCHPDRDTALAIDAAGFARVTLRHVRVPFPIIAPHIVGVAETV